jgi:ATP-dependent Clp protease ATP-binding subunit ClpB
VEKAHPQVLNVLLQMLDDGRLTDGQGRTVDFSNVVIILTSNIGAPLLLEAAGQSTIPAEIHESVMKLVRKHFSPEFLNRLDDIVMFRPLMTNDLRQICRNQVLLLDDRLRDREVTISITDAACDIILRESYNPAYGARPVRRYIEKAIVSALSRRILSGEIVSNAVVIIDADKANAGLTFSVKPTAAAAAAGTPASAGAGTGNNFNKFNGTVDDADGDDSSCALPASFGKSKKGIEVGGNARKKSRT